MFGKPTAVFGARRKNDKKKKICLTVFCTVVFTALSGVTAFADVAPIPEEVTVRDDPTVFVLIAAAVVIAAAVILRIALRNRKK